MANKRMFNKELVCDERFNRLKSSTKYLFFMLCLYADDEGVVSNPKGVAKYHNCTIKDLKNLYETHYVLTFSSGICVIKHWFAHNYNQKSHIKKSTYQEELSTLEIDKRGFYTLKNKDFCRENAERVCRENAEKMPSSIDKYSIDKIRLDKNSYTVGAKAPFTPPTLEEVQNYIAEKGYKVDAEKWWNYYDAKDWYIGKNKMVKWKSAVATWNTRNYDEERKAKIEAQKAYAKDVEMRAKSTQQKNQENFDAFGEALGRIANKYEQDRNTENIGENQTDIAYISSPRDLP